MTEQSRGNNKSSSNGNADEARPSRISNLKTEAKVSVTELVSYDFWVPKRKKERQIDINTMATCDSSDDESSGEEDHVFARYPPTLTTTDANPEVRLVFSLRELKSLLGFCEGMQKVMGYGGGERT